MSYTDKGLKITNNKVEPLQQCCNKRSVISLRFSVAYCTFTPVKLNKDHLNAGTLVLRHLITKKTEVTSGRQYAEHEYAGQKDESQPGSRKQAISSHCLAQCVT